MKTYTQTINGDLFEYFYDPAIKMWTIIEVDDKCFQLSPAGYIHSKDQMILSGYDFKNVKID